MKSKSFSTTNSLMRRYEILSAILSDNLYCDALIYRWVNNLCIGNIDLISEL